MNSTGLASLVDRRQFLSGAASVVPAAVFLKDEGNGHAPTSSSGPAMRAQKLAWAGVRLEL